VARWETRAEHRADVAAELIWSRAYADASAWPTWNPEIAAARLDGPLALGARARIRFRTGARMRFVVTEFSEGRLFTDEARLPGARMAHRHELSPDGAGGTLLVNTISLDGPLAALWARLLGRRAAAALPASQRAIAELARAARHPEL
jgi:Polyketide cyclase / dehydrase and lipid transport